MVRLMPIKISIDQNGTVYRYKTESKEDGENRAAIRIVVLPTGDGQAIKSIDFRCLNFGHKFDSEDDVANISFCIKADYGTGSFLRKAIRIIESLNEDDLFKLSDLGGVDTTISYKEPNKILEYTQQRVMDLFVSGISIYLTGCYILSQNDLSCNFPFNFTLPYSKISFKYLTENVYSYLFFPLQILYTIQIENYEWLNQLSLLMINFSNSFGKFFDKGEVLDNKAIILESLFSYSSFMLKKITIITNQQKDYCMLEVAELQKDNLLLKNEGECLRLSIQDLQQSFDKRLTILETNNNNTSC